MSQRDKSIIEYFTPDGQLREKAGEFEGLDLEIGSWDTARVRTDFRIHADF